MPLTPSTGEPARPEREPARSTKPMQVTVADGERRGLPRAVRVAVVALAAVLASAGVLVGVQALASDTAADSDPRPEALDARSVTATPADGAAELASSAVPGATRLALLGPLVLLDTRGTGGLPAGGEADLPLPALPPGSTAVLLEVSLLEAAGPGAVTVGSPAGERTVLQVPGAGAQTSATSVVPVGPAGRLQARTEGGGQLLVNLVGAFEPTGATTAGRIVPVPATRVLRLVPETDGKDATIDLAGEPALREAGSVSAVLLQIAADVGTNGGFVAAGSSGGDQDQQVFWTATAGEDRTRAGFLVVPVTGESVDVHYEAGDLLTADLVGYVTDGTAPAATAGLVVPVPPAAAQPAQVAAGEPADLPVVPPAGLAEVPAERAGAALLGVTATGDAIGGITVYPPGAATPPGPILTAAGGGPRATVTLVELVDGTVRVGSEAGGSVALSPEALILNEGA